MGLTPAVALPDERTWLLSGTDLRERGYRVTPAPASASVLVAPARVPDPLVEPLLRLWDGMPAGRRLVVLGDVLGGGRETLALLGDLHEEHDRDGHAHDHHSGNEHADHHGHGDETDGHGHGHGGHDHHDMMAVTGDPSRDGLVMEDLEVEIGPFGPFLATGIVASLTLDGDVVCAVQLGAVLESRDAHVPDPTAKAAWLTAVAYAVERAQGRDPSPEERRARVIAVELERATSRAAWLAQLASAVGWGALADAASGAARATAAVGTAPEPAALRAARATAEKVVALVGSRRLRHHLRGVGRIDPTHLAAGDLAGPVARSCGLDRDARSDDPVYAALGFAAASRDGGDAEARALLAADELVASLSLTAAAGDADLRSVGRPEAVEGPYGPVAVRPAGAAGPPQFDAPGQAVVRDLCATAATGLEWSSAVAALASFDLSGWSVSR